MGNPADTGHLAPAETADKTQTNHNLASPTPASESPATTTTQLEPEKAAANDPSASSQSSQNGEPPKPSSPAAANGAPKGGESEGGGADDKPARTKSKTVLLMLALCLAVFLAAIDMTIITTALPSYVRFPATEPLMFGVDLS